MQAQLSQDFSCPSSWCVFPGNQPCLRGSGSTSGYTTSSSQSGYEHENKFNVQKKPHRWHSWASRKCSAPSGCSSPCCVEAEEPLSPGQGWIQCGVPSPGWAGTAGASLRCHRPPQRGLTEESTWEGPTGSSFQPLSVEDDLFVLGVGDLPSCLEPPDGLPHVLGLQGGQLPPLLTHIQRWKTEREVMSGDS